MPYPLNINNKMHVEIHHDCITKDTQLLLRDNRGQGSWIKCDLIDIIYHASHRVFEDGRSNDWYNPRYAKYRAAATYLFGRVI